MLLEGLIFDVDGTLAENEEWHRRAFNESFEAFGLDWHWDADLYRQLLKVTGGKERIRHFIETASPPHGADVLAKLSAFHADKTARYADYVVSGAIAARPGIKRLVLEAHRSGVPLGIATTTTLSNVEALVKSIFDTDARHLFSVIAAGDIVPRKKPAPDIYVYACERLGVPPSACIAIEDSENGTEAAHSAGITVVAAPCFYSSGDDFSHATCVVSDLGEPDAPNRYIAGKKIGHGFVDLASLRDLSASRVDQAR
jgi:HAD superfamily hydrolase (TIGR01509 family)